LLQDAGARAHFQAPNFRRHRRTGDIQSFMFSQLRFGADMDRLVGRSSSWCDAETFLGCFARNRRHSSHTTRRDVLVPSTASSRSPAEHASWPTFDRGPAARRRARHAWWSVRPGAARAAGDGAGEGVAGHELACRHRRGEAPAVQIRHTLAINQPLLAIVDYAELRVDQLMAPRRR